MCGRYVAASPPSTWASYFDVDETAIDPADPPPPSWNVAPTDPVPAVAVGRDGQRRLGLFRWGLVPPWAQPSVAARMINARAETVLTKPAFKRAFARHRCLLPADGFYEWQRVEGAAKRPWYIHRADGAPMAFAGLWEVWRSPAGEPMRTCSIITTTANPLMAPVHDRMPVILEASDWRDWLAPDNTDLAALQGLLVPADERTLTRHGVSTLVNSVRNNGPDLIELSPEGDVPR
jgi:putative SOS response-associated peptidase YedK